ncbi:MAG: C4-dicarboxylate transporter DcuC [Sutterellaceae bacterium]|nr:C4-dicarboxylate transporter DcuC [Sutterellaceae bacterium]MDY2868700.1 C4-dicarboxylate transporter DcuC [Mesosutterella sp.]
MQTFNTIMACVVVIGVIYGLIKRYETRLVLITGGLVMAFLSLKPMVAFHQFDASMTRGSLIIAICSAMGFAAVVKLTGCDVHLVSLLTKPLKKIGILLLPACCLVTGLVAIAIPSTAGCCAAVGPTLIPLMIRAGFKPAVAAAAVVGAMTPAYLSPGVSHNVFISKMAGMEVMDFIMWHAPRTLVLGAVAIVALTAIAFFYRDYKKNVTEEEVRANLALGGGEASGLPEHPNVLMAIAPLVPVVLLVIASLWFRELKVSVATAMLIGTIYALAITRTNPAEVTTKFFDGMGRGYAKIMGIIIAAGVFAAGLKAAGVIGIFVDYLKHVNEMARLGGALGPFLLGLLTGSGDAATFAFNEAVTPHATEFGLSIPALGYLAALGGSFGRQASPLCGGLILVAGIAGVSPMDIVKRTAPAMALCLVVLYFLPA